MVQATGGTDMVRAAYSSGTPAYGVGAGNSTMVIDETADVAEAARNTRLSKTSDFGSGCSADGNLIVESTIYDALRDCLVDEGGHLATPEEAEKLRAIYWDADGHRTARHDRHLGTARWPRRPASRSPRIDGSSSTEQTEIGAHNPFSSEKLGVVLSMFRYSGFDDALEMVGAIYEVGGKGHSCGIYSFDDDHIDRLAHGRAGQPDHGPAATVEGERGRVRQRDADDLEPRLRDVGRQHHLREHPPQALHEHHLGEPPDRRGPADRGGALRRLLRDARRLMSVLEKATQILDVVAESPDGTRP